MGGCTCGLVGSACIGVCNENASGEVDSHGVWGAEVLAEGAGKGTGGGDGAGRAWGGEWRRKEGGHHLGGDAVKRVRQREGRCGRRVHCALPNGQGGRGDRGAGAVCGGAPSDGAGDGAGVAGAFVQADDWGCARGAATRARVVWRVAWGVKG